MKNCDDDDKGAITQLLSKLGVYGPSDQLVSFFHSMIYSKRFDVGAIKAHLELIASATRAIDRAEVQQSIASATPEYKEQLRGVFSRLNYTMQILSKLASAEYEESNA